MGFLGKTVADDPSALEATEDAAGPDTMRDGHFAVGVTPSARLAERRALAPQVNARYSRYVSWAKVGLPAIAATMAILVAAWPYVAPLDDRFHLGYASLNLKDALELKMLNARFSGIDKSERPYTIVSEVARQIPKTDNLVSLEHPTAELHTHSGDILNAISDTGMYQSQSQMLDMFSNVTLVRANGDVFNTQSARINMQAGEAEGHEPVEAHGGFGNAQGEGLRVVDRGDTIIFTGQSHMLLTRTASEEPDGSGAAPAPSRPPAVAKPAIAKPAAAKPVIPRPARP